MVRRKQSSGLSPQQLKHFAIAAVSVTALLALFASGEEWGASAQLEAVEAKNRLAATEAEKLGTAKVKASLKIRKGVSLGMGDFGGSGSDFSGGAGGGGGVYELPERSSSAPLRGNFPPPPPLPAQPGASVAVGNQALEALPPGAQPHLKRKAAKGRPDPGELEELHQGSNEPSDEDRSAE